MIIGTVVEGLTDRLLLQAVINRLIPGQHRYLYLQPKSTLGETGGGWKGVRRWCRQTGQRENVTLDAILSGATGPALDVLVIHVDADVAREKDLQDDDDPVTEVQKPCPPVAATAVQLRQVVTHWLRQDALPPKVVLAIPAQDTESWTFAALYPADPLCARPDYECLWSGPNHPGYRLTLKRYGKLLRRTGGQVRKSERAYKAITPRVAEAWAVVCTTCSQAERFAQDIKQLASLSDKP